MSELYTKLAEIQKTLKAPKNQFNSFGNYKYRSCEDILEAIKPLLGDATLTISDEIIPIGNRFYVKAEVTLRLGEDTNTVAAFAREEETKKGMDAAQITGACSSYARKYALNGMFLIDDTKDADTMDNKQDKQPLKDIPDAKGIMENKATTDQIAILKEKKPKGSLIKETIGRSITKYSELTYDEADKIITEVNEHGKE